jgi:hypothetical protein
MADKIDKSIEKMIKDNDISKEDITVAKTILTWMEYGKKEASKISKIAVKNLIKNGFVDKTGEKLIGDSSDIGMWFLLAMSGARGYIEQVNKEASNG